MMLTWQPPASRIGSWSRKPSELVRLVVQKSRLLVCLTSESGAKRKPTSGSKTTGQASLKDGVTNRKPISRLTGTREIEPRARRIVQSLLRSARPILIFNPQAHSPADYVVETSIDGVNYQPVVTRLNPAGVVVGQQIMDREARFIRLATTKVHDGSGWALSFFEIWAEY